MNWSRVKTILIILFLCTDLFLVAIYMTSRYSATTISGEMIENTVSALKNNKITINPDIIPRKIQSIPYAEAENAIPDYESFAKKLLGNNLNKIDYGYSGDYGTVTFYGDRFNYQKNPDAFILTDSITINKEQTAKDVASADLKQLGFDLSKATVSASKKNGNFTVVFENKANELPIFNSRVTVELSKYGVVSISGIWFNQTENTGNDTELKKVTSALIQFIPQLPDGGEIVKLQMGYNIFDKESFHKSATLIPVWHITCKDGSTYLLDARNTN